MEKSSWGREFVEEPVNDTKDFTSLFLILRMFGDQDRLRVRRTPRYWKDSTLSSGLFEISREGHESIKWECL